MSIEWFDTTAVFRIASSKGDKTLIPETRNWTLKFRGFSKNFNISVSVNNEETKFEKFYDSKTNTTQVKLVGILTSSDITVSLSSDKSLITDNSSARDRIFDILLHAQMSYDNKMAIWNYILSGKKRLYAVCCEQEHKTLLGAMDEMLSING